MEEIKSKIKKEAEELRKEFVEKTITLILAGFGLVAALAWNEAIKSLLDLYLGAGRTSIMAKFIYAILVTAMIVLISRKLSVLAKPKS